MIDRYTKVVLTVIAAALTVIAVEHGMPTASALGQSCGGNTIIDRPCRVEIDGEPIQVLVVNLR